MRHDINVILHCAAIIRFDSSPIGLSAAVKTNVRGLREMLTLAREAKGLVSFVYVSTGYVQSHLRGEVIQVGFGQFMLVLFE